MAMMGKYVYQWPRPMVTVDAMIFAGCQAERKVLLIKRGNEPFKGMWALPGGFVEMDEELIDAANRELFEETGVDGIELKQLHTFGGIGRDPRGRLITIVFFATLEKETETKAGDDAAEAKWFAVDQLPEMAFDHREAIRMGLCRIS